MSKPVLAAKVLTAARVAVLFSALISLSGLVANLVLARFLEPEHFGGFAFCFFIVGALRILASIKSDQFVIQTQDEDGLGETVSSAFIAELGFATVVFLLLQLTADSLMRALGFAELTDYLRVLGIVILFAPFDILRARFTRDLDFRRSTGPLALGRLSHAFAAIIAAYYGLGIWSLVVGELVSAMVGAVTITALSWSSLSLSFRIAKVKAILPFGMPLVLSGALVFYYWNIDDFMVGEFLGKEELGYYWLAFRIPHYVLRASGLITSVSFPTFSRIKDEETMAELFRYATKYTAYLMLLLLAPVLVYGDEIILMAFGEKWRPAILPFKIFMSLVAIRAIFIYWVDVYRSVGRTVPILKLAILNATLITLLGYFFMRAGGIVGMSLAVLVTITATIFLATRYLKRLLPVNYGRILLNPLIVFALSLTAGFGLYRFLDHSRMSTVAGLCVVTLVFLTLAAYADGNEVAKAWKIKKQLEYKES